MGLRQVIVAFAALLLGAGPALADDYALNKEGYWTVGRGDADAEACKASFRVADDTVFLLAGTAGEVTFAVMSKRPMRAGKRGLLATETHSFDFAPHFSDTRDFIYVDENLSDTALAALKLARALTVKVDGRAVFDAEVEGTGLENAVEAVIACSKGEPGWWGPGLVAAAPAPRPQPVLHAAGIWEMNVGDGPTCIAQALVDGGRSLQLLGVAGRMGLAVGLGKGGLPRGREAQAQTDGYAFAFPVSSDGSYLNSADPLDVAAVGILRQATRLRITVGGKLAVEAALEGSGFPEVVDAVVACSRGEKGWWGDGAKQP
jgi:hypothetical protein